MNDTNISLLNSYIDVTTLDLPDWAQTIRIVFFVLIFACGVPGNTIVLAIQSKNKSKTSTDWLVAAMAGTDLCGAGISCSLYVIIATNKLFKITPTSAMCQGHFYCIYITSVSSALLLCVVAIDRYSKACRPHSKLISVKRAKLIGVITMSVVTLLYSPSFMIYKYDILDKKCSPRLQYQKLDSIVKLSMSLAFMILFSLTIFSYLNIALAIRKLRLEKIGETASSKPQRKPITFKRTFLNKNRISPKPSTSKQYDVQAGTSNYYGRVRLVYRKNAFLVDNTRAQQRENGDLFCDDNHADNILQSTRIKKGKEDKSTDDCAIELNDNKKGERSPKTIEKGLILTRQKANTTTKIMFLLTVLFIVTWLVNILSGVANRAFIDNQVVFIISKCLHPAYMLNFVSNPVFYVCLSTKYKSRVHKMLCIR